MLKSKQISEVLVQGLKPISSEFKSSKNSPLSLSLLSHEGLPLNTVINYELLESFDKELNADNLKIYSILGLNFLTQQLKASQNSSDHVNDWAVLELNKNLNLLIQKVTYKENEDENEKLYLVIFYDREHSNTFSKLRLDNICSALKEGLKGYERGSNTA